MALSIDNTLLRLTVCLQVSQLGRDWLGSELLSFVRWSVLLALGRRDARHQRPRGGGGGAGGHLADDLLAVEETGEVGRRL